jgi:hypothetical protein
LLPLLLWYLHIVKEEKDKKKLGMQKDTALQVLDSGV